MRILILSCIFIIVLCSFTLADNESSPLSGTIYWWDDFGAITDWTQQAGTWVTGDYGVHSTTSSNSNKIFLDSKMLFKDTYLWVNYTIRYTGAGYVNNYLVLCKDGHFWDSNVNCLLVYSRPGDSANGIYLNNQNNGWVGLATNTALNTNYSMAVLFNSTSNDFKVYLDGVYKGVSTSLAFNLTDFTDNGFRGDYSTWFNNLYMYEEIIIPGEAPSITAINCMGQSEEIFWSNDETPTCSITTDFIADCEINGTACASTNSTSHVCTQGTALGSRFQDIYLTCRNEFGDSDYSYEFFVDIVNPGITNNRNSGYVNGLSAVLSATGWDNTYLNNISLNANGTIITNSTPPGNNTQWNYTFTAPSYGNYTFNYTAWDNVTYYNSNTTESIWIYFSEDSCGCPGLNNDWDIKLSDNCNTTVDCNIGTGTLSYIGQHTIGATITAAKVDYQKYIVYEAGGQIVFN